MRWGAAASIAVVALAVAACAPDPGVKPPSCPGTISTPDPALQRNYAEFKRSVESSPLARQLAEPIACRARTDDGRIQLNYESARGGRLEARRDPAIESTEQRLSLAGLSEPAALALLQRTEQWAFGDEGCSIAWKNSPEKEAGAAPDSREEIYRGEGCNCQARLVYRGEVLTALIFRSAC
jgi:hypothetical protein